MTRHEISVGEVILVSACLLGVHCRYDGNQTADENILALAGQYRFVPVCPEQLGGLPTPRSPVELRNGRAMTDDGQDVTRAFERGAQECCRLARLLGARTAILQPRSPSCGLAQIYDGSFSGRLIAGQGLCARALAREGLAVLSADDISFLRS